MIRQGDIYWLQLQNPEDQDVRIPHPYMVLEVDPYQDKVTACGLTTNLSRVSMPGNVLLDVGEGNLPKQSVVEVAKVAEVEKSQLGDYIGSLSPQRVEQIVAGMRFLQRSFLRVDTHE